MWVFDWTVPMKQKSSYYAMFQFPTLYCNNEIIFPFRLLFPKIFKNYFVECADAEKERRIQIVKFFTGEV